MPINKEIHNTQCSPSLPLRDCWLRDLSWLQRVTVCSNGRGSHPPALSGVDLCNLPPNLIFRIDQSLSILTREGPQESIANSGPIADRSRALCVGGGRG
ncbi:hypothetical protein G7K_4934-t1 [Saitoella complicata NRRL Y-17804]|uniref:Uncharacterized protein n=1 Tax=Saitoella complicata (strain BCRC 22490 / CBS 7301 / JCM 7358 / NBRC 10748 / NRRL Y-17804) TaxID=698492 RepID=A0A0E9NLX6_SAICN|nr:hypothetical protein G7K_4934-t1 [Saitoella complicata NRRL Y-17804]